MDSLYSIRIDRKLAHTLLTDNGFNYDLMAFKIVQSIPPVNSLSLNSLNSADQYFSFFSCFSSLLEIPLFSLLLFTDGMKLLWKAVLSKHLLPPPLFMSFFFTITSQFFFQFLPLTNDFEHLSLSLSFLCNVSSYTHCFFPLSVRKCYESWSF